MAKGISPRRGSARPMLVLVELAVFLVGGLGLLVAWSHGAFDSRVTYWRARGQGCGAPDSGPNTVPVSRSAAEQAVACFAAACAHCRPAALTRNAGGVDRGEQDTFVVEQRDRGGGGDVGLEREFDMVSGNTTTTTEVRYAQVTSADGGLTISGCQGFSSR